MDDVDLLSGDFDRALEPASKLHRKQPRKGADSRPRPYMSHLLAVASAVMLDGARPLRVTAAALALDDPAYHHSFVASGGSHSTG